MPSLNPQVFFIPCLQHKWLVEHLAALKSLPAGIACAVPAKCDACHN